MANKVEEIIKEKFIKAIENGETPIWRSPYVGKHAAINRVSKRTYRGINMFFLHGEYASFKQWSELGYNCDKGKGEIAFFNTKTTYAAKDKDGNPLYDKDGNPVMKKGWILRYYNVWERHNVHAKDGSGNIAPSIYDDEGTGVDETPATECEENAERILMEYIENNGFTFQQSAEPLAYFMPISRVIHMPHECVSKNAYIGTLAHECAHSTGASHLLGRNFGDGYTSAKAEYSREELIAETASALFCAENGVAVDFESTTAYLKSWAKYLKETPAKTIVMSIYHAQKAARLMNGESLASVKGETTETKEIVAA